MTQSADRGPQSVARDPLSVAPDPRSGSDRSGDQQSAIGPRTTGSGPQTTGSGPRTADSGQRIAIVHDWLTGMRGGEKVLEAICELYPSATLFTLVRVPGAVSDSIERHSIVTSPVQHLPWASRLYRQFLPLFPATVELFDFDRYDLVISSSHCAVKSIIRPGRAVHLCYCHSPMRYAWDQFSAYFGPAQVGSFRSGLLRHAMAGLARWDAGTAGRVDRFLANSQYVAGRIRRYYNRGSTIVYPPVATDFYLPFGPRPAADPSCLLVSALVPYKRVDIGIAACRLAGLPLKIVGRGPEEGRLRAMAGSHVEFLGWRNDEEIRDLYRQATAVLLPGIEDFGMVPVEAQACGTPVVALREGGACETVIDGVTGVLVEGDSADAFAAGLRRVQALAFDRPTIVENAQRFSRQRFLTSFRAAVDDALLEREIRP
jgi:glycosyltransferase involved in cell wall biosynthesis